MDAENIGKQFPSLPPHSWRSDWPYIVTLTDGANLPAYPVIGSIDADNNFCFGASCTDAMWYVSDRLVEHPLITELPNGRIIRTEHVDAHHCLQRVLDYVMASPIAQHSAELRADALPHETTLL